MLTNGFLMSPPTQINDNVQAIWTAIYWRARVQYKTGYYYDHISLLEPLELGCLVFQLENADLCTAERLRVLFPTRHQTEVTAKQYIGIFNAFEGTLNLPYTYGNHYASTGCLGHYIIKMTYGQEPQQFLSHTAHE